MHVIETYIIRRAMINGGLIRIINNIKQWATLSQLLLIISVTLKNWNYYFNPSRVIARQLSPQRKRNFTVVCSPRAGHPVNSLNTLHLSFSLFGI